MSLGSETGKYFARWRDCVLTDFGISQIVTKDILKVKQFEVVQINGLSIAYAAPERLFAYRVRNTKDIGADLVKSWDVYSFGIIIYEISCEVKSIYK